MADTMENASSRIAVIGGGASGCMAAIAAAQAGCRVTIFEKNEKIGKKIYSWTVPVITPGKNRFPAGKQAGRIR